MRMLGFLLASLLGAGSASAFVIPEASVYGVLDQKTKAVLGSATHVCVDRDQDRKAYLLTNAHVIRGVADGILIQHPDRRVVSWPARIEFVDTRLDVALISMAPFYKGICLQLAPKLRVREAYHPLSGSVVPGVFLHSFVSQKFNWLSERKSWSLLGANPDLSFPGRDHVRTFLLSSYQARPGDSGGALIGYVDREGVVVPRPPGKMAQVLGLIMAYEKKGFGAIAVPSSLLLDRLALHFAGHAERPLPANEVPIDFAAGTFFPKDGVIALRRSSTLLPSGTGQLGDGGTGQLADGGTGQLADGGVGPDDVSPARISGNATEGLVRIDAADKTWLKIGAWTQENEISSELLAKRPRWAGIFKMENGFYLTNKAEALPRWLPGSGDCIQGYASLGRAKTSRHGGAQISARYELKACEHRSANQVEVKVELSLAPESILSLVNTFGIDSKITIRLTARKDCASTPCRLFIEMKVARGGDERPLEALDLFNFESERGWLRVGLSPKMGLQLGVGNDLIAGPEISNSLSLVPKVSSNLFLNKAPHVRLLIQEIP